MDRGWSLRDAVQYLLDIFFEVSEIYRAGEDNRNKRMNASHSPLRKPKDPKPSNPLHAQTLYSKKLYDCIISIQN
jgi:hypothetical protein